ncbi:THBS2S [Mytilus edulis]|uniref:THBS2S n=1 Tax=Mytilus edulis TaxID=6550 RepID=A0A8S3PNR3_MYTED|nr:THBS2S [Mytilus edulis]
MEKLMSAEETSNQIIENLQNITSQQQHELNKAKSESKKSRLSVISSLTLLNNSLQELTISTSIGFKHLNGSVVKEKQLLIVREEMQKFERRINNRLGKIENKLKKLNEGINKKCKMDDINSLKEEINIIEEKLGKLYERVIHTHPTEILNIEKEFYEEFIKIKQKELPFENTPSRELGNDKTVDGQWSSWIDTPSSVTCGVGCRLRYRECSNPFPQQGGKKCAGSRNKYVKCLQYDPCPVHGAWSVWSENTCSVTCGVGTRLRSRNCSNPHPQYGGNNCTGNSTDHVTCTQPNECPVEVAPKTTDAPQTSAHFCNLEAERGSCTYYKVKWSYSETMESVKDFDVCKLPQSSGPCTREHRRWHFDQTIKDCREFLYGGCRGNKNRFITRAECLIRCGSDGYFKRYRYSAETGDCEEFIYGGCNGNSNNFETMEACRKKCV